MKKTAARSISTICAISLLSVGFSGYCNASSIKRIENKAANANVTISVSTNAVGDNATVLKNIATSFHKKYPYITVNFTAPGSDYENIMKVKMASNSMPDVFATHGWAVARYGKFLYNLKSQSWAKKISPSIKKFITDSSGKVYVLPMDMDETGINYNVSILKKYNLSVPTTWSQFLNDCKVIKTKSNGTITPIHIGGGDSWTQGQFFDFFAIPALEQNSTYCKQLKNGTFNWRNFDVLPTALKTLWNDGYLNKDYLTSKYEDSATQMAKGKVAFTFYGPSFESEILTKNPKANIGMMPIPSMGKGKVASFAGGEKTTWGVWKNTKHLSAALKFVSYYAQTANIQKVCKSTGLPSGLTGITVNNGQLTNYFKKYHNVKTYAYFDREYLPDGMWDVMTTNAGDMISGNITASKFSDNMKTQYTRLRASK